jgi:hypothetical protein
MAAAGSCCYAPLNSGDIRLLTLLPGQFPDPLLIDLRNQVSLRNDLPTYEALSYAWGTPESPEKIQVLDGLIPYGPKTIGSLKSTQNLDSFLQRLRRSIPDGRKASGTLTITQNLALALRHLRKVDTPRVLWVDAICIDQTNLKERSAEVL